MYHGVNLIYFWSEFLDISSEILIPLEIYLLDLFPLLFLLLDVNINQHIF